MQQEERQNEVQPQLSLLKNPKFQCVKKLKKEFATKGSHVEEKLPTSTVHNRIFLIIMLAFAKFYFYTLATILFVQYFSLLHKYNDNKATHSLLAIFL